MVWWKNTTPPKKRDVHILIPRTCDNITSHDKRNFADVIQVKDLEVGIILGCQAGLI